MVAVSCWPRRGHHSLPTPSRDQASCPSAIWDDLDLTLEWSLSLEKRFFATYFNRRIKKNSAAIFFSLDLWVRVISNAGLSRREEILDSLQDRHSILPLVGGQRKALKKFRHLVHSLKTKTTNLLPEIINRIFEWMIATNFVSPRFQCWKFGIKIFKF